LSTYAAIHFFVAKIFPNLPVAFPAFSISVQNFKTLGKPLLGEKYVAQKKKKINNPTPKGRAQTPLGPILDLKLLGVKILILILSKSFLAAVVSLDSFLVLKKWLNSCSDSDMYWLDSSLNKLG
jgi:hypothetical protein